MALLAGLEWLSPIRPRRADWKARWFTNAALSILVYGVAAACVRPAVFFTLQNTQGHQWGILPGLGFSGVVGLVVGFLFLDLSFYFWHRLNHEWAFLWRFHNVHHLDPGLDVTTGFRFHFVEVLLSSVFRVLQVFVIGPDLATVLFYEAVFQGATFFHHSNIKIPERLSRLIDFVLVTPRMHTVHHSMDRRQAFSNYSVVFSFWDRVLRTYRATGNLESIRIGIPAYSESADNQLARLMRLPFEAQRDYWGSF
jgi:sterol desaturase/sphingolipid hydroxylase (fatty acid hydroxylase superfamily)